uniref:Uncharacterized protein n=1 Tax=Megaselia scalaris TaxID=36166 RepID=T1GY37_MEGSC
MEVRTGKWSELGFSQQLLSSNPAPVPLFKLYQCWKEGEELLALSWNNYFTLFPTIPSQGSVFGLHMPNSRESRPVTITCFFKRTHTL